MTPLPSMEPSMFPSIEPSSSPTLQIGHDVNFKYIIGFEKSDMSALKLAVDKGGIMSSVKDSTGVVLTEAGVRATNTTNATKARTKTRTRTRTLRKIDLERRILASFGMGRANNSIENIKIQDVKCPNVFNQSKSCVLGEIQVQISANPKVYSNQQMIDQIVLSPMESSMKSSQFLDALNRSEVKEILFVGSGDYIDPIEITNQPIQEPETNIPFIAVALGGSILIMMGVAIGRSRVRDKRVDSSMSLDFVDKLYEPIDTDNRNGKSRNMAISTHVDREESATHISPMEPVPDATPVLEKLLKLSKNELKLPCTCHSDMMEYLKENESRSAVENNVPLSDDDCSSDYADDEEWMSKISYSPDPNVPLSFSGIVVSKYMKEQKLVSTCPSSSSGTSGPNASDTEESEYIPHHRLGGSLGSSLSGLLGGCNTKLNPLEVIEERIGSEESLNEVVNESNQGEQSRRPSQKE